MRLADVHQRQHHENESLQDDDQDVEDRPDRTCQDMANEAEDGCHGAEQGNEQEQQFAGVHVAEQSHAERYGFCHVFDDVQEQIERRQLNAERRREQFVDPAAQALDLQAVVDHQREHAERNAQGAIQVGGRNDAMVADDGVPAHRGKEGREHVDRQEVERVHQGNPDEHGQRQRRDEAAVAVHDGFRLVFNHFDQHFDGGLEAARHAGGGAARGQPHQEAAENTGQDRPENRVQIENAEIDNEALMLVGQVPEVMLDVFRCSRCMRRCGFSCCTHVSA